MTVPTVSLLIGLACLLIFGAALAFAVWRVVRARKLPPSDAKRLRQAMERAQLQADAHRRVLDAEKVLDQALAALGYGGTFADKLRTAGPRFSHTEAIWRAHKLRNRIAHEIDVKLDDREAKQAVDAFRKALEKLA